MTLSKKQLPFTFTLIASIFFPMNAAFGNTLPDGICQIEFEGSSTLGKFPGEAASEEFQVMSNENELSWDMRVPVNKMDTYNKTQNKKMFRMLKSEDFPYIKGKFQKISLIQQNDTISFEITIKGIQRKITAQVNNWNASEAKTSFDLIFPILLKDFALRRPSFLGFLKVAEKVQVTAHFTIFHKSSTKGNP